MRSLGGLWGLGHSSHKNQRRRGPGYHRVGDIPADPPLSGSVTSTNSGYSPQAGQSHTSRSQRADFPSTLPKRTTPKQRLILPWTPERKSLTSLLEGNGGASQVCLFSRRSFRLHSRWLLLCMSMPTSGSLSTASPLWVCLAPTYHSAQPAWGLTHGGSSASPRPGSSTLIIGVCSS